MRDDGYLELAAGIVNALNEAYPDCSFGIRQLSHGFGRFQFAISDAFEGETPRYVGACRKTYGGALRSLVGAFVSRGNCLGARSVEELRRRLGRRG